MGVFSGHVFRASPINREWIGQRIAGHANEWLRRHPLLARQVTNSGFNFLPNVIDRHYQHLNLLAQRSHFVLQFKDRVFKSGVLLGR